MTVSPAISVALTRCASYARPEVEDGVRAVFAAAGYAPAPGTRVLVKPNFLKADPTGLCCTHPEVVRAACVYLLDRGCRVTVGDSPAFGSAARVASSIGLAPMLSELGVPVITLDSPRTVTLPSGMRIGISRHALETDAVLSVPRIKAHTQMRLTCSVKNLFGCVSGVRKAVAHSTHGDKGNAFRTLLAEVPAMLPPTAALADGIVAMDRMGPSEGDPCSLGVLGAALEPVALDTAIYTMLGTTPQAVPLWGELQARKAHGARMEEVFFPMLGPDAFRDVRFRLPRSLTPESFHPLRLLRSAFRRLWARYRP